MRGPLAVGVASLILGAVVLAQSPAPPHPPAFEVASIKRNISGSTSAGTRTLPGGRITITNNPLRNMIRNAYGVQGFQIVGGPDWVNTDRWDIVAKAEGDVPREQMSAMMQALLADRFNLVIHRETREMPIYALRLARGDGAFGPQLRRSVTDCAALMADARARGGTPPSRVNGRVSCGMSINNGRMEVNADGMPNLVRNLAPIVGRIVVDKTGLTGSFDLDLTWAPEAQAGSSESATPTAIDGPSIFTAMQEQLGLKLEPQRGPVDVLVIDSAERPMED